jgi:hypothetical protein
MLITEAFCEYKLSTAQANSASESIQPQDILPTLNMKAYFSLLIFVELAVHLPLIASAYPVGRKTDLPFAQYPGEGEEYGYYLDYVAQPRRQE